MHEEVARQQTVLPLTTSDAHIILPLFSSTSTGASSNTSNTSNTSSSSSAMENRFVAVVLFFLGLALMLLQKKYVSDLLMFSVERSSDNLGVTGAMPSRPCPDLLHPDLPRPGPASPACTSRPDELAATCLLDGVDRVNTIDAGP